MDQGSTCPAASWAFAASEQIESDAIRLGLLTTSFTAELTVSAQQLLSCNNDNINVPEKEEEGAETTTLPEEHQSSESECLPSIDTLPEDIFQQIVNDPAPGLLKTSNSVPFMGPAAIEDDSITCPNTNRRLVSGSDSRRLALPLAMRSSEDNNNDKGIDTCYLSIDAWFSLADDDDDIARSTTSSSTTSSTDSMPQSQINSIPQDRMIPAGAAERRRLRLGAASTSSTVLTSPSPVKVETRMMTHLLSTGTLAVCLDASTWNTYVSGIVNLQYI
jgi:hypothetical protein